MSIDMSTDLGEKGERGSNTKEAEVHAGICKYH